MQWFYYREKYTFPRSKGVQLFPGWGVQMLSPLWIRTYSHRRITLPHYTCKLSILLPLICYKRILCSIFLLLSGILDIKKKYGDIYQSIRDTCLFLFKEYCYPPPPLYTSLYSTWVFCEHKPSYSHLLL